MSDNEGHGGMPPTDDDLSLPKATVAKMIAGTLNRVLVTPTRRSTHIWTGSRAEYLPKDVSCARETRDLIIECCVGEAVQKLLLVALSDSAIWTRLFNTMQSSYT